MAKHVGANRVAEARTRFDLLSDLRGRHGILFYGQARGEFRQDPDTDSEFFEITMSILETAGYEHYEISNYARPGFRSAIIARIGRARIIWGLGRALFPRLV